MKCSYAFASTAGQCGEYNIKICSGVLPQRNGRITLFIVHLVASYIVHVFPLGVTWVDPVMMGYFKYTYVQKTLQIFTCELIEM